MTQLVGSIIIKVYTGNQVPGAINTHEAVTYIDVSHATCLRSRRSVGSYIITLL